MRKYLVFLMRNLVIFAHSNKNGDVAQLARALDWQSRGRRFEPDLLHVMETTTSIHCGFFVFGLLF